MTENAEAFTKTFLDSLLNAIREETAQSSHNFSSENAVPLLPNGTKVHAYNGRRSVIVVEEKPQTRTIMFNRRFIAREKKELRQAPELQNNSIRLAFPYILFVLFFVDGIFHGLSLFYRNAPLASLDDALCHSNMPNDLSFGVCLGRARPLDDADIGITARRAIDNFWQSVFTTEGVRFDTSKEIDRRIANVFWWHNHSMEDPAFPLAVNWIPANNTLRSIVREFLVEESLTKKLERFIHRRIGEADEQLRKTIHEYCESIRVEPIGSNIAVDELEKHLASLKKTLIKAMTERLVELAGEEGSAGREYEGALKEVMDSVFSQEMDSFAQDTAIPRFVSAGKLVDRLRSGVMWTEEERAV